MGELLWREVVKRAGAGDADARAFLARLAVEMTETRAERPAYTIVSPASWADHRASCRSCRNALAGGAAGFCPAGHLFRRALEAPAL